MYLTPKATPLVLVELMELVAHQDPLKHPKSLFLHPDVDVDQSLNLWVT